MCGAFLPLRGFDALFTLNIDFDRFEGEKPFGEIQADTSGNDSISRTLDLSPLSRSTESEIPSINHATNKQNAIYRKELRLPCFSTNYRPLPYTALFFYLFSTYFTCFFSGSSYFLIGFALSNRLVEVA